jgi:hypothetical protein
MNRTRTLISAGDFVEIVEVIGFTFREPGLPGDTGRAIKPFMNPNNQRPGWVVELDADKFRYWVDDACLIRLPPPTQIVLDWRALRGIWQPPRKGFY